MATSAPLSEKAPEETDNPAQELADRELNPEAYRQRQAVAAGDPSDPRGDDTPAALSEAEQSPDEPIAQYEDQVGRGYRNTTTPRPKGMFRWSGFSGRKKLGIGVGGGIIGGGIIALMITLLPALRLDGYLAGVNQRVFAAANNAVQQRTEKLFEHFMITRLLAMDKCGGVVSSGCRVNYANTGFASSLFNTWQDAKVEDKLINEYGFKIVSHPNPAPGQPRFVITDRAGNEIKLSSSDVKNGSFLNGNRAMGKEINAGLKEATRWDQVLERRSIRKYLVRKHGVKFWCFFACNTKDSIDNAKVSATTKLKYKLIERTVYPFSQKYGLIMKCLTGSDVSMCDPDNLEKAGLDRSLLTDQDLKDLESVAKGEKTTLSQILIEKLLLKIGMDEGSAKVAAGLVPIAGQIYLGLSAVDTLETMKQKIEDGTLSKIAANVNSDQYVEYYTAMRSANDEALAGKLSEDEVGALVSQFNDGNQPAEHSLVYQTYNNSDKSSLSLLGGSAYAASSTPSQTTSPSYTCSNGQPIPAGMLVCPEKTLNKRTFKVEQYFKDSQGVINTLDLYGSCIGTSIAGKCVPPLGIRPSSIIHPALQGVNWAINNTLGTVLGKVLDVLNQIPGISNFINLATSWVGKFFDAFFNQVFPLPLHPDSPGRDKYDALEAGGEITASEFNQGGYTDSGQPYGLGGRLLTNQEQADASQAYLDQQNYDTSHSSLLNRIAGADNPNSLLTRFAMAMPASWSQLPAGIAGVLSHPFRDLGAIWHPAYAAADTGAINAFGVPRFGYTTNDPAFSADPSIYTPQYCDQLNKNWQASKTQDPVTGINEYSTTNPCLLEQVSVEAASSAFTQDDSLDDSSSATGSGLADDQQLAQQILNNSNISYPLDASSSNGSTKKVLQTIAAGQPAPVTCPDGSAQGVTSTTVDPHILQFILDLGNQTKIGVNAITDKCHVTGSNHYQGKAVDFECQGIPFDVSLADSTAKKYGLSRNDETCAANSHWHYSTDGR